MKRKLLLITAIAIAPLLAQQPAAAPAERDPFADATGADPFAPAAGAPQAAEWVRNLSICYEVFSLPLATAASLQRESSGDADIYEKLLAAVKDDTARQEAFVVLRARSGQKSMSESLSEQIYPTEYEPPELPNSVGVAITGPKTEGSPPVLMNLEKLAGAPALESMTAIRTPATPTAFETRNAGLSVEIEPTMDDDGKIIDLRINPSHVTLVDRSSWGKELSEVEMPVFESQTLMTSATLRINQPFLLGTLNLPPKSQADPDSANRVWFAFVTGTLAKP